MNTVLCALLITFTVGIKTIAGLPSIIKIGWIYMGRKKDPISSAHVACLMLVTTWKLSDDRKLLLDMPSRESTIKGCSTTHCCLLKLKRFLLETHFSLIKEVRHDEKIRISKPAFSLSYSKVWGSRNLWPWIRCNFKHCPVNWWHHGARTVQILEDQILARPIF